MQLYTPHSTLSTLRAGICLITALAAALVVGCGSACGLAAEAPSPPETNAAPELTPVPTRDVVIKPIEDVLSPTPAPAGASTGFTAAAQPPPTPSRADSAASGSAAPDFSLASAGGNEVSLSGLLEDHRAVVLVFYRGYF